MSELTLEDVDRDEALTEAIDGLCGSTRASFLRGAALGGAAMLTALSTPSEATAAITDVDILNFGLRFERLQATFYTQAHETGTIAKMAAAKKDWAETLGAHERAHVRIIKSVLGSKANARPFFNFGDATETDAAFTKTAVAMEDLTVAARHAAWARHIIGSTPAPTAFDRSRTLDSVQGTIARTRFIVTKPRTS